MTDRSALDRVENWPQPDYELGSVAHVHAFGQIALMSVMLEEMICMLLIDHLPMSAESATSFVHGMNNRGRADWLKAIVSAREKDPAVADLVIDAIRHFDICMDNRNMLVHALCEGTDMTTSEIRLSKKARNDPLRKIRFKVSLNELRNIADDVGATMTFAFQLWIYLRFRGAKERGDPEVQMVTLPAFPQKPAQPNRLTIPQHPADPEAAPPRRKPLKKSQQAEKVRAAQPSHRKKPR